MERRRGRAREKEREREEVLRIEWEGGERERMDGLSGGSAGDACMRVDLFISEIYTDLLRILNSYGGVCVYGTSI